MDTPELRARSNQLTRSSQRQAFDMATRIALVESDIDRMEASIEAQTVSMCVRLDKLIDNSSREIEALRDSLSANQRILIGMLCSLVVACVMLTINVVVQ